MQDKTRTKLLAGVLGGTVLFAGVRPDKQIMEPLNKANQAYTSAVSEHQTTELAEAKLFDAKKQLKLWNEQSLPPNSQTAMRVYQQWINDLADECSLSSIVVETGGTSRKGRRDYEIYKSVEVKLEAEGTFAQISRFVYRFNRADRLQRILSMEIESEGTEGDPYMTVNLVAEGVCMAMADKKRQKLFNESELASAIEEDSETIKVDDPSRFPSEPGFEMKVGTEYVKVTAIAEDGTFTVKRGADDSEPTAHDPNERVQYAPVAAAMTDASFSQFSALIEKNPFVKPVPEKEYDPRISSSDKKDLLRGKELDFRVSVASFNPTLGGPVYELVEGPEGMTLDEKGKLKWKPADDAELKDYVARVKVKQSNNPEVDLDQEITVTLKIDNKEPTIRVPRGTITAWLGQTTAVDITIDDDDSADRLTFSIEGVENGFIDSQTGQFKWTPGEEVAPGEYEAVIKVTDRGQKSAEGRVRFVARDDAARYTKLTSAVSRTYESNDGKIETRKSATLRDNINGKTFRLSVGSEVRIADIFGTVKDITERELILTTAGEGDATGEITLSLGRDNLRDARKNMKLIEPEPKPEEAREDPKVDDGVEPPAVETKEKEAVKEAEEGKAKSDKGAEEQKKDE